MEIACLHLAEKLINRLNLSDLLVESVSDINAVFFKRLFDSICVPYIVDPPNLSDPENYSLEVIEQIVEIIGNEFLNFDISQYCPPEEVINGNLYAIHYLLVIFDNLCDCLLKSDDKDDKNKPKEAYAKKRRPSGEVVPEHLRAKLRNFGKKSIIYSPRTSSHRDNRSRDDRESRPSRSRDDLGGGRPGPGPATAGIDRESVKNKRLPDLFKSRDLEILKRCGVSAETIDLLQLENALHRVKLSKLLHLLRAEHRKSETDAKHRLARVILRRSIKNNINRAQNNKNRELLLKKSKLAYENALKEEKRKPEMDFLVSDSLEGLRSMDNATASTFSSTDSAIFDDLYSGLKRADDEARKFLKNFASQQKKTYQNNADSTENFEKDTEKDRMND